jgi:hypothetical protein
MKRVLYLILMAVIIVPAFVACKKGPNDPSISLKSRNARVIAKWKLTAITGSESGISGTTGWTTSYSFNGTTYSATSSLGGTPTTGTGSFDMTIEKEGKYSYNETFTPSGSTAASVTSGNDFWYWADNDNNKIAIYLGDGGFLFGGGQYNIDELKSKELILKTYTRHVNNGATSTLDLTYTFVAQ